MRAFCRRKSDGALFEPSYPDGWTDADAIAAVLSRKSNFYFRRIRVLPRRWWQFRRRWWRTGEIWEANPGEFDVLSEKEVLR